MAKKKSQPPPAANDNELDTFALQVEQSLTHFAATEWLGNHSPLAAPYFLGRALTLPTLQDSVHQRGEALQRVLLEAAAQIDDELRELLQVVYFGRNPQLENVGLAMRLHMSERTFYRTRLRAIRALAQALNQLLVPPLRPEIPNERALIGRAQLLTSALEALHAGHSLYLSGPSGVGKTTLGTSIVRHWMAQAQTERHAFWYTVRAGLNDQVSSLLFALGYFLRGLGAGYTWRQLVADRGVANPERILGLLRYDLDSLRPMIPLLYLDELDVLQAEISEHAQILHLLEELRAHCVMLLIGQQVVLDATLHLRLAGLDERELEDLLVQVNAPLLADSLRQRLLAYTRGNPALLLLFTTLLRDGDDAEAALQTMANAPSLEALFYRIWRRLNEEERLLLMQLAVFRNPAPLDAWQEQAAALAGLRQRELVQVDDAGGVRCDLHLQRLVYNRIPAELKPLLHVVALDVREARAEYLAAMYHAIEARQPARAVWLWFVQRSNEIDRGGGAAALGLLKRISTNDLADERDRTALRIARAELLELAGNPEEAEQELHATQTAAHTVLRAYVRRYEGIALDAQGRIEQALEKYRESLDTLAGLPQFHEAIVHSRLSFLHLYRLHNIEQARKQALLARAKADGVLGDIELMAGRYALALEHLLSAKTHAEKSGGDLLTLSRIYSFLGHLYLRLRDFDNAILYIDQAIECDRKRGDEVGPLYDLLNRAMVHMLAGRFEQSYQDAHRGLEVAKRLKNSYLISGLAAGVAEACYGLQQWQRAEEYASFSLSQEEEFFRAPALVILGMVRQKQGKYAEGVTMLGAALENARQIKDRYTEAYVWHFTGLLHRDQGVPEAARLALESAHRIYQDLNLSKDVETIHAQLQELASMAAGP